MEYTRNMSINDVHELYIQLGYINKLGLYVYLPFEAFVKRWSTGFPMSKGAFYEECKFNRKEIRDSVKNDGESNRIVHVYGLHLNNKTYKKLDLEVHCAEIKLRVHYDGSTGIEYYIRLRYDELILYLTDANLFLSGGVTPSVDIDCTDVQITGNRPAYYEKLKTKLSMTNRTNDIITDGFNIGVVFTDIKEYVQYMSRIPCYTSRDWTLEQLKALKMDELKFNDKTHIIVPGLCSNAYPNDVKICMPTEIWMLRILYDTRFVSAFKKLSNIVLGFEDDTVIECVSGFNISWLKEEAVKVAKYVRRVYEVNRHNLSVLNTGKILELKFEHLVYMGVDSINLLMPVIYNFADCKVEFSAQSIIDSDTGNCKLVFKTRNRDTLLNLIEIFKNKKMDSRVLVITDNEDMKAKNLVIIREDEYNSWGLEDLPINEYFEQIDKKLKLK